MNNRLKYFSLRLLWAVVGLILSVPAFGQSFGFGFLFDYLACCSGRSPTELFRSSLQSTKPWILPAEVITYNVYSLAFLFLTIQFVAGKRLSRIAGVFWFVTFAAIVAIMYPWHWEGVRVSLKAALLNPTFVLTLFIIQALKNRPRKTAQLGAPPNGPRPSVS